MPLSPEYCRATDAFLKDNGVDPEDVSTVMEVLGRYQAEAAEDAVGTRGTFNGYLGQDALRRRQMAADRALPAHLRRFPAPAMSVREQASFEARFPGVDKIRVV